MQGTLGIEFERDQPFGLEATLGDGQTIFLVSGIFPGKADSAIFLGFECTINPQNLIKIVEAIFWENENFNFFSVCELPLILRVGRKRKKRVGYICKGTLDIACERDWSVGLGAALGETDRMLKTIFLHSWNFFGKSWEGHIVGLPMYYKPIKFNQNRLSHFWENQNF